jgi:hypothetical protein
MAGKSSLQALTRAAVGVKAAMIVFFKISRAVLAFFCWVSFCGFFPASARTFTSVRASALSSGAE